MWRSFVWVVTLSGLCSAVLAAEWQPKQAPLMTKWAKDVTPQNVHAEYPRPQMVREKWVNLNGLWDYAITDGKPNTYADRFEGGKILVPFPVESALSGVMKRVPDNGMLLYRRTFVTPEMPKEGRLLLHFGAVDWETVVSVNGKKVGEHRGGYDPFTFDITDALRGPISSKSADGKSDKADFGEVRPHLQELIVAVNDPTDGSFQPRGKQVRKPEGIWYTPTTGIWQTVWLEPVPKVSIRTIQIVPDMDAGVVRFRAQCVGANDRHRVQWTIYDNTPGLETNLVGSAVAGPGEEAVIQVRSAKAWTPDAPFLYTLDVSVSEQAGGGMLRYHDGLTSYLAMRKISLGKDEQGVTRMMLNNKPLFQFGPLDQGFWPDGLYTAPTDEALKFDIEQTKAYGFNMIRKHVKVEPARWYYHCDKLGMLVWQDMPSGDRNAPWDPVGGHDNTELTRTKESSDNFNREWKAIIDSLRNHPCIVMWVPFNEGWGQANTVAVTKWTKEYDPTRLVNCASGGNDFPVGDVIDVHRYPGPFAPKPTADRAAVLGEYGGLGLPLKGHTWQGEKNWGYRSFTDQASLTNAYLDLLDKLHPMIGSPGLSAAIYTQTTDVEIEVNGLLTYDRAVQKIPLDVAAKAHKALYQPPPQVTTLIESSREAAQTWQYTTDKPADGWEKAAFDASKWKTGPGGFGEKTTPNSVVRTEWKSNDIWLRRTFDLKAVPTGEVRALIHHDEDTDIYINGQLVKSVTGYSTDYGTMRLAPDATKAFKAGTNTLAVHCKQTGGGQYIDVGFVELIEAK